MPRPKIYATNADKHAEYRKRLAKKRQTSEKTSTKVGQITNDHYDHSLSAEAEEDTPMQSTTWHEVIIKLDRSKLPKPAHVRYIMNDEELEALQADLTNYTHSANTPRYGTYAYGESDYPIAGTTSLAFIGMEIEEIKPAPGFIPSGSYAISQGVASLLREQIRH